MALLSTAIVFLVIMVFHPAQSQSSTNMASANVLSNNGAVSTAPLPMVASSPVPALVAPRPGPGFNEVDARMDDRGFGLTETQKQTYWNSVAGTQVMWEGVIEEVSLRGGGEITLKCGPQTLSSDTVLHLDGTQSSSLQYLKMGQRLRFTGFLEDHTSSGYSIKGGRIG